MIQTKLEFGEYYHIYNRGNNRGKLFIEDKNYIYFLSLYKKYILPIANLHAYCLLPNHFHFLIQIKENENWIINSGTNKHISIQFATFFGTYTKSFNKRYLRTGVLYEGRYQRKLIVSDTQYFQTIIYIHQNPQKHGLVANYCEWPYSSYQYYQNRSPGPLLLEENMSDEETYNSIMERHNRGVEIN